MQALIAEAAPPDIAPGDHCFTPYECPYYAHCTRDRVSPDHGIGELPRLRASRRAQLEDAGIEELRDIPDEFPLTRLQRVVRRAVREQERRGSRGHFGSADLHLRPRYATWISKPSRRPSRALPARGPTTPFRSSSRFTPSATACRPSTRTTCTSRTTTRARGSPTACLKR